MGLYNVQTVNGAIATVELSDEDAEKQGLLPGQRLDAPAEAKAAGKSASRARGKTAAKVRSRATRGAKPVEVRVEEIVAANDTTVAAVDASDGDPAEDAAQP